MEVKMNKEIRNYQESMFMGLNLRQCIFSLLAIAVAVGIYFGLGDYVGQEMTGWLCILGAAPFAACGFFQYHGMNAEQFEKAGTAGKEKTDEAEKEGRKEWCV